MAQRLGEVPFVVDPPVQGRFGLPLSAGDVSAQRRSIVSRIAR